MIRRTMAVKRGDRRVAHQYEYCDGTKYAMSARDDVTNTCLRDLDTARSCGWWWSVGTEQKVCFFACFISPSVIEAIECWSPWEIERM